MKLLLTSGGLRNEKIIGALQGLVGKKFEELNVAFVPTASNIEMGDKKFVIKDLETLVRLGFKEVDIVDFSALPKKIWLERLNSADIIFVEGGNSYYLMYWIEKVGLDKLFPKLLKHKIYIGVSAGSLIVSKDLALTSFKKQEAFIKMGGEISGKGLGLVNFYVKSHINSKHFPDRTFAQVEETAKKVKDPVYALDDNSAVVVNGNKVTVVSEGDWKKIN